MNKIEKITDLLSKITILQNKKNKMKMFNHGIFNTYDQELDISIQIHNVYSNHILYFNNETLINLTNWNYYTNYTISSSTKEKLIYIYDNMYERLLLYYEELILKEI